MGSHRRKVILLAATVALLLGGGVLGAAPAQAQGARTKHVILMIADGWGYNQVAATDYYEHGELGTQVYEQFPVRLAMSTYAHGGSYDPNRAWRDPDYVRRQPTDSAAAATALACGVKTYRAALGVGPGGGGVRSNWELAEDLGMATGVVTTVPLSHATPAGFVAHCPLRHLYRWIARQMLLHSRTDVIIGCGHPEFDDDGKRVAKPGWTAYEYVGGHSLWEKLRAGTAGGDADGDGDDDLWQLVEARSDFQRLMAGPAPARLLGVPQVHGTLQQDRSGDQKARPFVVPLNEAVPTLAEMARAALNVLDDDPDGFCLMVEGGAVDSCGHDNTKGRLIEELMDFNRAVEAVVQWVETSSNWAETLLIVTGDHECGYLTGPAPGPTPGPIINKGQGRLPGMMWRQTDHTNQLIPLYANGEAAAGFAAYADETDPVRGPYIDNTEVAALVLGAIW